MDANGNTLAPDAHLPRVQVPGSAGVRIDSTLYYILKFDHRWQFFYFLPFFAFAALIKPTNNGCGFIGLDKNSG